MRHFLGSTLALRKFVGGHLVCGGTSYTVDVGSNIGKLVHIRGGIRPNHIIFEVGIAVLIAYAHPLQL